MTVYRSGRSGRSASRRPGSTRRGVAVAVALFALCLALPAGAGAFGSTLQWKGGSLLMPLVSSQTGSWEGKIIISEPEFFYPEKGYSLTVECTDALEGSIGASGAGEITGMTATGCVGIGTKNTECNTKPGTGESMKAVDLPWRTELVKSELGPPIERIVSDGKGTPGVLVKCKELGVGMETTCTGNLALNINKLEPAAGTFNNKERLSCTVGNPTPSGFAEGTQTLSGTNNIEEGTPVWNVSGEHSVGWSKGTLTILDRGIGVTCEEAGEGTVSTAGKGGVSKVTLTGCSRAIESECTGKYSIEALHLPWKTQLYFGELESLNEMVAPGTGGAVAFKVKCELSGIPIEDTCEVSPETVNGGGLAATLTNGVESGVKAHYYNHQSLKCGRTGGSEIYESSHTVKLTGGGTLAVSG